MYHIPAALNNGL